MMPRGAFDEKAVFVRVVHWQSAHGRQGLPWQNTRDPYRVWLSEIMLQQTQVVTVLKYYATFLRRFPNVQALASADVEDVFALWSGLGYYTRARNLHRCAQKVVQEHGGLFPQSSLGLVALPGIGPSTAAAIAAFCFGERTSIFDGNVKRVLARALGFSGDLSFSTASASLHSAAQGLVPPQATSTEMAGYTQGLMDLGATVCTRSRPKCDQCPLATDCLANANGLQTVLPVKSKRIKRSTESWWLLMAQRPDGAVCLIKRPERGIWSSLWCFPVFTDCTALMATCASQAAAEFVELPTVTHTLTHRDLVLTFVWCAVSSDWAFELDEASPMQWVVPGSVVRGGVPVPVIQQMDALVRGRVTP